MTTNHPHRSLILGLCLVLSACASNGLRQDDYDQLRADEVQQLPAWSEQTQGSNLTSLNQLIDNTTLDQLVSQALTNNPSLQQTLLTLQIRQAEQQSINGGRLPALEAGFSAGDSEDEDSSYTGSLSVSWQVDLWNQIGDSVTAAGKDVAEQQALYQAARDTLAGEVMRSWLGLIAQQHAVAIEQRRLSMLERNETFIMQRYRNGLGSLEDLDSARSSAASSRATLSANKESLAQQERALQAMLGSSRPIDVSVPEGYPGVLTPLAELPEQSLERRPDLQAAWLAIQANDLRTSVAYKDMLPKISLQAALQDIADSPSQALLTDPVWSLLGQLTAPLYQGGQLRAAADIAELTTAQSYQAYRDTLITAVTEVENALGQERTLAQQQQHIETALERQQNNLTQYQQRYRNGTATVLELLIVQQQTYNLEAQLDTIIYNRLANRVVLGLALGLGADQ